MKSTIVRIMYRFLAPWLRSLLSGRIAGKPLSGSSMILYYDRGQHLGFLGHRFIQYEPETRKLLGSYIRPGCLIFEIGSNIGQLSLWLAEGTGPDGRVVCVEPDPDNLAFLHFNVRKNQCRQVDIQPWAISDKPGKAVFHRDVLTGGRAGTLLDEFRPHMGRNADTEVEVRTYRDLIRLYGHPDVVKVDVEGAEHLIFSDSSLLRLTTVYFIEVRKETREAVFTLFHESGFKAVLAEDPDKPVNGCDDLPDFCNLLFVHPTISKDEQVARDEGQAGVV